MAQMAETICRETKGNGISVQGFDNVSQIVEEVARNRLVPHAKRIRDHDTTPERTAGRGLAETRP
jgi:predicted methyltransferase